MLTEELLLSLIHICFQLFLDDTPQSHIATFRPDVLADQIDGTSTNKNAFQWTSSGAYSRTRAHERGVLDKVELLQSFLYPAPVDNEETPKFAQGGVVSMNQFRPPATLVFALGPIYLEGVLKSAPVNYTLFDSDLTPIRATVDVEIGVFELSLIHILNCLFRLSRCTTERKCSLSYSRGSDSCPQIILHSIFPAKRNSQFPTELPVMAGILFQ